MRMSIEYVVLWLLKLKVKLKVCYLTQQRVKQNVALSYLYCDGVEGAITMIE